MAEGVDGTAAVPIGRLERDRNGADGVFGGPSALDADFIDIRGGHRRGR